MYALTSTIIKTNSPQRNEFFYDVCKVSQILPIYQIYPLFITIPKIPLKKSI